MNRRVFIRSLVGATAASAVGASACAYGVDTQDVEINHVPIKLGLQQPLRVAALGDLHFDPVYDEAYLAHVVQLVNGLQPDYITYTGDFVTSNLERVTNLADILAKATPARAAFAVPGNHEGWTNRGYIQGVLDQRAGIRMLCNQTLPIPGEDNVFLTGLDTFSAGRPRPGILDHTPANSRHIVLAHEPDSFNQLTDSRIRLQISGHTHGGQVRLPIIGALILPKWGRDFQQGLFTSGDRQLYVNRGIGTLGYHFRINCRPEITLFELS
jgi:predicted MPP superfamily phosphohydrolase